MDAIALACFAAPGVTVIALVGSVDIGMNYDLSVLAALIVMAISTGVCTAYIQHMAGPFGGSYLLGIPGAAFVAIIFTIVYLSIVYAYVASWQYIYLGIWLPLWAVCLV